MPRNRMIIPTFCAALFLTALLLPSQAYAIGPDPCADDCGQGCTGQICYSYIGGVGCDDCCHAQKWRTRPSLWQCDEFNVCTYLRWGYNDCGQTFGVQCFGEYGAQADRTGVGCKDTAGDWWNDQYCPPS